MDLGNVITDAQKTAISNGTFENLSIGDYWSINGVVWRIGNMDLFRNSKDDQSCMKDHLVIMPDCDSKDK